MILIASWLLRAFAPGDPSLSMSAAESGTLERPASASPNLAAVLKDELAIQDGLKAELASLQEELGKKLDQCKPTAVPAKPESDLPAERWSRGDLTVLKGCWMLGKDVKMLHTSADGQKERVLVKAGRICFGDDGTGMHEQDSFGQNAEWHCRAPITARFWANGTLTTRQPAVLCEGPPPVLWAATTLACHRESDVKAMCTETDKSGRTRVEFRRAP